MNKILAVVYFFGFWIMTDIDKMLGFFPEKLESPTDLIYLFFYLVVPLLIWHSE